MRALLPVLLAALAGCGSGPSDELVETKFKAWCNYSSKCESVGDIKSITHVGSSDSRKETRIIFAHKNSVVEVWCLFTKPRTEWNLEKCWSYDLGIDEL